MSSSADLLDNLLLLTVGDSLILLSLNRKIGIIGTAKIIVTEHRLHLQIELLKIHRYKLTHYS